MATVGDRPLCDRRYDKLTAGKLPFMRDVARLAGLGMSLLGEVVEPLPNTRVDVHKTCPNVFP